MGLFLNRSPRRRVCDGIGVPINGKVTLSNTVLGPLAEVSRCGKAPDKFLRVWTKAQTQVLTRCAGQSIGAMAH